MAYTFEEFSRVFAANLHKRSRTVKGGIVDTSTSPEKKELQKSGRKLVRQVKKNTLELIETVWREAHTEKALCPAEIRRISENYFDIINQGFYDPEAYRGEFEQLELEARRLAEETGGPYRINRRYRVWQVPFTPLHRPVALELCMDDFYSALSMRIDQARTGIISQADLLSWTDYVLDKIIHPWIDGCARHATAMVMWLSLLSSEFCLPVFGRRAEHYAAIYQYDPEGHRRYYERCLTRGK